MASISDTTHHTDPSTGQKVQILTGQGNYTAWMRDLKLAAEGKDVWILISPESFKEDDCETIHTKPTKPEKPNPARFAAPRNSTPEAIAELRVLATTANDDYRNDVTDYRLLVSEYEDQQKRLREARSLLQTTVTPAIRDSVSSKPIAAEMLKEIKKLCKMTDGQAQQLCYQKLDNVKYSDFSSVSDCINTITTYQQELKSINGNYGDEQVISKVISILPEPFNEFTRYWNMLSGSTGLPRDIQTLHQHLLGEEARLNSEGKLQQNKKKNNNVKKEKKDNKEKDDSSLHECKFCHKMVKHKEQNCWDNPDNKDKKPAFIKKEPAAQANVTIADSESTGDKPKKKKSKLVIAAAAVIDRETFQEELEKAFRTDEHQLTPITLPKPKASASSVFIHAPSTDHHTSKTSVMSTGLEVCDVCETIGIHSTETHEWAVVNNKICETCDTVGFHSTDDHHFAMEMSKNMKQCGSGKHNSKDKRKGKVQPQLLRRKYGLENAPAAFVSQVTNSCTASDPESEVSVYEDTLEQQDHTITILQRKLSHPLTPPRPHANLPQVEPREESSEGKGGQTVRDESGVNDLQVLCEHVFSTAEISLKTIMTVHDRQVKSSIWIVDSGANICIVNDKSLFTDFRTLSYKIGTADDDNGIQVVGGGNVTITLCVDGEETADLNLSTVAYAPNARCNILSMSWIAEKSAMTGNWGKTNITLMLGNNVIGVAPLIDGLYQLQIAQQPNSSKVNEPGSGLVMATNGGVDTSSEESDEDESEDEADQEQELEEDGQSYNHHNSNSPERDPDDLPVTQRPEEVTIRFRSILSGYQGQTLSWLQLSTCTHEGT